MRNGFSKFQYKKSSIMKMNYSSSTLTKDTRKYTQRTIAIIGSLAGIAGTTFYDIFPQFGWIARVLIVLALWASVLFITRIVLSLRSRKNLALNINGNSIEIVEGDLFKQDGLKIIPFSDRFDTKVDDIVISRNSLNGIFIEEYVRNKRRLRTVIGQEDRGCLGIEEDGKTRRYESGTIKCYDDYLLLAFAKMNDNNEAHLDVLSYVECLIRMWQEISRVYAGRPVNLPLLGSGITRFDDMRDKSEGELLKYILFTLKITGLSFTEPVRIVLKSDTISRIRLYEMKEIAKTFDGGRTE